MLDRQGRKRALTKYERKQSQIEDEYLRQTYPGVVVDGSDDERPILCHLHGWRGPESRSDGVVIQAWGAASLCPGCEVDRNEAEARRLAPPRTDVIPAQGFRNPTPAQSAAWDEWVRNHKDELLRSRPYLVEPELEKAAIARMDETHLAAKRSDRLTVEQKAKRRHRSYVKYWGKRIARGTDPSLAGLPPRNRDENEVVIEIEGEDGQSAIYDPHDDWNRNADSRSFLRKWLDDERRSRWMPRRATPIQEKAESLVDKIGAAIRSVLSEPAEEDNGG
jgi:hypothetical protein